MLSHALFLPALFSTLSQSSHSYDPELYPSLQSSKIYPNNLRSAQQSISVSNMWIKFDFFKQIIKNIYCCLAKTNAFSQAISWGVFWLYKSKITFVCSVVRITLRLLIVCVCVFERRQWTVLCFFFRSSKTRELGFRLQIRTAVACRVSKLNSKIQGKCITRLSDQILNLYMLQIFLCPWNIFAPPLPLYLRHVFRPLHTGQLHMTI